MRVLIVDDEPAARRRLALMLEELDEEVVGEAANGVEALEMTRERAPDLLLLDIRMPEVDGLEVARHLPEPGPLVIFQTAYEEHALEAFEHEAVDYVVKPVDLRRLGEAMGRARRRMEGGGGRGLSSADLGRLREAIGATAPAQSRILVRQGRGYRLVEWGRILRFSAESGLSVAHTEDREYLTDHTLAELESRFPGTFLRVSRSDLVNRERIQRFLPNRDGSATLTLDDGTPVRVARRRAPHIRATLDGRTSGDP